MGKFETVILLTATVNPNGMSFTALQDRTVREEQYKNSLFYYLENTDSKIVFCENSGTDLSSEYRKYIDEDRIEFLTFDGNDYDKRLGKGYGEAKIILYAINNSKFIKRFMNCYIVKITGRVIVRNIGDILNSRLLNLNNIIMCDFMGDSGIYTMILVSPLKWIRNVNCHLNEINDTKGVTFEQIMYKMLLNTDCIVLPFSPSPIICGVNGSSGLRYEQILPSDIHLKKFLYLSSLYKKKGIPIIALFAQWYYLYYTKFYVKFKRMICRIGNYLIKLKSL